LSSWRKKEKIYRCKIAKHAQIVRQAAMEECLTKHVLNAFKAKAVLNIKQLLIAFMV